MTALLDLHPGPGHPGVVVAGVHEALDGLSEVQLNPGEYAGVVAECARARSRIQALELKLVAAAAKARVPQRDGARSAGSWLASKTRAGQAQSARDAKLAADLDTGLPATATALAAGEVSAEHAAVIAHATRKLPQGLTPAQTAAVEKRLVEKAKALDHNSCGESHAAPWRQSRPTSIRSTPTRTPSCATRRPTQSPGLASRCTTTATAPPPATSPSRPSPRRSSARSSMR
jgi:hypothetical protein